MNTHLQHNSPSSESATDRTLRVGLRALAGGMGGLAGFALSGPLGAAVGAVMGGALPSTLEDMSNRMLSERERARVGGVSLLTANAINDYINAGHPIRSDGFFDTPQGEDRAAAEEVAEAVLTAAQHEYEELKLPYYSYMLAAIAVSPDVSRSRATYWIRLVQDLSMNQLIVMSIAGDNSSNSALRVEDYNNLPIPGDTMALLGEIFELDQKGLITFPYLLMGISSIKPAQMRLQGEGVALCIAMRLHLINMSRKQKIITALS